MYLVTPPSSHSLTYSPNFSTDFSPSPQSFTVSSPTSLSLLLSWTLIFPVITPNSFSIQYTINKLSGALPATTDITLTIALDDTDLTIEDDGGTYSYLLQGLTYYTEYTFTLSTVYGNSTSDTVTTSTTTTEGSKYTYQ